MHYSFKTARYYITFHNFYTFTLIPFFTEITEYVEIEEEFDYKSGIQ
jgi:hypothetical protein